MEMQKEIGIYIDSGKASFPRQNLKMEAECITQPRRENRTQLCKRSNWDQNKAGFSLIIAFVVEKKFGRFVGNPARRIRRHVPARECFCSYFETKIGSFFEM